MLLNGKTINEMVRVAFSIQMEPSDKDYGWMIVV